MGYRSEVALVMKKSLVDDLKEYMEQVTSEERDDIKDILCNANNIVSKDDAILYHWMFIKWYPVYLGILCIHKLLEASPAKDYLFLRLGDETDDIETLGSYYDNPFEAHTEVSIVFNEDSL